MTEWRIRDAGDSAVLLEADSVIDPRVNDAVIAAAAAVRRAAVAGVHDVLSTYRTVVVHLDPAVADLQAVRELLERASSAAPAPHQSARVEVPVYYGGRYGPDLEAVAAFAGLLPARVIERHARTEYRVYMFGFLPGFAYMGTVDADIAAPRRETPRMQVAAGSVGIAGRQTGIYSMESPGGWQIIGRTPLQVFDAARAAPSLFAPGDCVTFAPVAVPAQASGLTPAGGLPDTEPHGVGPSLTVLRPGLFTTVQDEGRWGWQSMGVPVSGAMDLFSHRAANALVGNSRDAATLEVTIAGPDLRLGSSMVVAVTGADLGATLDGATLATNAAVRGRAGSILRFAGRRSGGRAYVALAGGVATPPVLGSRSTHVGTRMGGVGGRALRAGDHVRLGVPQAARARRFRNASDSAPHPRSPNGPAAVLRVLPGPHDDWFPAEAFDVLQRMRFLVTPQSNRMGYRLAGPRPIPRSPDREMISDGTYPGAIQVPPSGAPILLMADRQTTGGYPQVAVVITADLPLAGQLVPGDWVMFHVCSRAEARAALALQQERLQALE